MSEQPIRIARDELFNPEVDKALARQRSGRERIVADPPPVSGFRRLMNNSLFYLPVSAILAALSVWLLLEPKLVDFPTVGGEVMLVNADPFDTGPGIVAITIGSHDVWIDPEHVTFEEGDDGQPAFTSIDQIQVGTRIEVTGFAQGGRLLVSAIRPTDSAGPFGETDKELWPFILMFPLTGGLIAFALLLTEGITTRNWVRMIERTLLGSFLAMLFAALAYLPAGIFFTIGQHFVNSDFAQQHDKFVVTIKDVSPTTFVIFAACRSAGWACIGALSGVGMNLVRSTRTQLRNSAIGGALGGALGGLFFDPLDRWGSASLFAGAGMSRLVGLIAVGASIGLFVALIERLGREAWLRVRTGPLAGKSFILYKTPTILGSAPESDVYLFKDAEIDASHAQVHRVGTTYEIEDMGSRTGTTVGGNPVRRRRLASGDQIILGSTILDFEERQKRTPVA
ncbi:MAG: FHA domain-containing protein [Kofleriaceae bacterium]|nr:FHA domain-containing protein [Kofleriaceae bacterium]